MPVSQDGSEVDASNQGSIIKRGQYSGHLRKEKGFDSETRDFLESLDPIMVCYLQDLHAKFYMNESRAVVTSMNLYEYSQVYNEEIGTEFTAEEDPEDFEKIVERFLSLVEASECVYSSPSVDQVISKQESDDNCELIPEDMECHCIRCGVILPHDQSTVYCDRCMRTWMKYLNPDYVEKDGVCFVCGRDFRSSARHPACPKCARLHQELVDDFSYWMGLIPENESLVRHYS